MANAVSDSTFDQEVLKSTEPVLVDFFAEGLRGLVCGAGRGGYRFVGFVLCLGGGFNRSRHFP